MLEIIAQLLCAASSVLFLFCFVVLLIGKLYEYRLARLYQHGKHWCNFCRLGFLGNNEQIEYNYCPYCGRPLERHQDDTEEGVDAEKEKSRFAFLTKLCDYTKEKIKKCFLEKKKQDNGVIRQFKSFELGFALSYAKTALVTMHYLKMGTPVDHNSSYLIEEATKRQKNGAAIITNFPRNVEDAE